MGISLHFAEAPTKEGGENSTGLLRTKWGKVYKALSCYSDWHCIHSVNVSCCLYYYPSLITVPSSNNPFPLYLCIVFTQKVLPTRADKLKASLLLKAHFNQWPFPRDLPWPSRHTAVSPFSPSLSPSPEHTSSLHFANWKSIRHWASVPPVCQGNNPLLSWLQAQKTSHERGCLLNHNMCTQSCLNSRLRNFIWCLRRMNFPNLFHVHLDQWFSTWSPLTPGELSSLFQEIQEDKTIFTILICYLSFHYVDACTHGAKAMPGKAGHSLASSGRQRHARLAARVFFTTAYAHALFLESKSPKNISDNVAKITVFIKVWPLSVSF